MGHAVMRYMFVLATFLVLRCPSLAWEEPTFFSCTVDKDYTTTVTRKALQASPAWKNDAENPPVSARKVRRLADEVRARLAKDTADYKWRLESLTLTPTPFEGKWYWLAEYRGYFKGELEGRYPILLVVVLMDGTVVEHVPWKAPH
jgi:hypothetical protein